MRNLLIVVIIEIENRKVVVRGCSDGGMGSSSLVSVEFPLCKMKKALEMDDSISSLDAVCINDRNITEFHTVLVLYLIKWHRILGCPTTDTILI